MTIHTYYESPLGPILLTSDGEALTGLYLPEHKRGPEPGADWERRDDSTPFPDVKQQLAAYFAGTLTEFDLPLSPTGTPFQKRVWEELRAIPHGETVPYGELARRLGSPSAARAVGMANGRNPISLIVPCHRVIGANGRLTGYAGGLPRKETLLTFEASVRERGGGPVERRDGRP